MRDGVKKFHTFAEKEFIRKYYPELYVAECGICRGDLLVEAEHRREDSWYICEECSTTTFRNN